MRRCGDCIYWDPKSLGWMGRGYLPDCGMCRRFPPTYKYVGTHKDDWCGEFSKKEDKP